MEDYAVQMARRWQSNQATNQPSLAYAALSTGAQAKYVGIVWKESERQFIRGESPLPVHVLAPGHYR